MNGSGASRADSGDAGEDFELRWDGEWHSFPTSS